LLCNRSGELFLVPHLCEPIGFELFIHGDYEPLTRRYILKNLPQGGTFVDVGANIGIFTVPGAKRVGPRGRVLAVEASPRAFRYLEHNVRLNRLENVEPRHCAAYDRNDEIAFWEAPADHFGMGSVSPQFHDCPIPLSARTLDTLLAEIGIGHVDVLKVDVEGCEAAVFLGAERLLTGPEPPFVLFEFCDWAEARAARGRSGGAQDVLREYGYQIRRLSDESPEAPPLDGALTSGFEMLVAVKNQRRRM
jgi:FkbM family methyltransferase